METNQEIEQKPNVSAKKNRALTFIGIAVMISVFIFAAHAMIVNADKQQNTNYETVQSASNAAPVQEGKQIVKLTIQNGNYLPNPVRLKKGIPAEIQVDTTSVRGCYRGIQIPAFGVRKVVSESDKNIDFTPDKAGTFGFSCLMGMGRGQIVVEDEAGNVPAVDATAQDITQDIPAGSCGSGGCGCGGY